MDQGGGVSYHVGGVVIHVGLSLTLARRDDEPEALAGRGERLGTSGAASG